MSKEVLFLRTKSGNRYLITLRHILEINEMSSPFCCSTNSIELFEIKAYDKNVGGIILAQVIEKDSLNFGD